MISSNYTPPPLFLESQVYHPSHPHPLCALTKTICQSRSALCCWEAVELWRTCQRCGPICTVTSSLVPCLQQEVELGQTGLGYYPPGGKVCMHVKGLKVSSSCWLTETRKKSKSECMSLGDVSRCILSLVCILFMHILSLCFACLRAPNQLMSVKMESCE